MLRSSSSGAIHGSESPSRHPPVTRSASTDIKRKLHETRQRDWLRKHGKHSCIDFSDAERTELRHFFEGLSGKEGSDARVGVPELEEMLISLGLADTRQDVQDVIAKLDDDETGELDFEEYLRIVCMGDADSTIFQVFKAMLQGKLGDKNLNFPNVISTYRRKLILDATGVGSWERYEKSFGGLDDSRDDINEDLRSRKGKQAKYEKMLSNFQNLTESRLNASKNAKQITRAPTKSVAGSLAMAWHHFCSEHNMKPNKPLPGAQSKLEDPPSPRTVLAKIPGLASKRTKVMRNGGLEPLRASIIY